jgi:hypothetical protein
MEHYDKVLRRINTPASHWLKLSRTRKAVKASACSAFALLSCLGWAASHNLAVADAPASPGVIFSPFGIGSDYHCSLDLTRWIPQMGAIGIHEIRTCYPNQRDYLDGYHIQYGYLFYGMPPGDTVDANGTLPVKDLDAWAANVTDVVKKADGRVKYYEVWNEPPNGIGPNQTAADYAKIMVSTYDAAHGVDPTCKVGLAAKSVDVNWLEQAIKAGAKDHFDYIVLHPYEVLGITSDVPGAEPIYMSIVPTVRKMLAAQDPAKKNVPIIFTEIGCDTSKGLDHPADALIKAMTMGVAQGVAEIDWFEGTDGDSGPMGLLDGNLNPRPAYIAYDQLIRNLGEHPVYLGWVLLNHKDYGFVFEGAHGNVLVTWAPKGSEDRVSLGKPLKVVDPLTGNAAVSSAFALGTSPSIVLDIPDYLVKIARADKTKPFPWGGDYSEAKSVSITMGPTNVDRGLHDQSAASVAADVIAYGGSARSGDIPGGTVFMVDPNFLSYKTTPIEITAVVRRDPAGDNAGFKLTYESTDGYKTLGWYTVPEGDDWTTKTWVITDPEFDDMYGYNFNFNSDGDQYDKYFIKSVTVTKLQD